MTVSVPTAPAPTPPVPPANDPGVLSKLLHAIGQTLNNPNDAGLLGMAQGFGAAAAPHMLTPVSMGQAFGMADQGAQQMRSASLQNAITQQALLPYQVMRTHALESSFRDAMNPKLPAHQRAAAAYRVDSLMGWNAASDPTVANRLAQIKAGYQPVAQGPGATLTTAAKVAQGAGQTAHGAVPEASVFNPKTGALAQAPGAPGVLAANAANKAGGAAAATYPYSAALHTVMPQPGLTAQRLGPVPGGFRPVAPTAPTNAAQQAAMQKMIGLQVGLTNAAQAAGRPGPLPATPGASPIPQPQPAGGPSGGWPQQTPEGVAPPGSLAAERAAGARNMPAVMAQARALSGPPVAAYTAQKSIGAQTGAAVESAGKESVAARQQIAVYDQMNQALSQMGPVGAWRDVSTPLGHLANYLGFTPLNIQSASEFTKYRTQLVGAMTKSVSPRASTQEMDFLARSVPNYDLPGNAAQTLVSELRGLSQYQVVRNNALTVYMQQVAPTLKGPYGGTALGFEKWFVNHGPSPSAIVLGSVLSSLPAPQAAAYVRKLQGTTTGKHMIRQYKRALEFQAQYPGVFQGF